MICPKCKKQETSILKTSYESLTNTVKRQRKCSCGYLFVTYEIDKSGLKSKSAKILKSSVQLKKKRKPTIKEEWIDFRVFLYGFMRVKAIISASLAAVYEFDKKFKSVDETLMSATKFPNKKSYISVFNHKKNKYSDFKIERVKQTIKKCVENNFYWKKKKSFFKNIIIPDLKNKRAMSDEINEYNRSITSYVRKDKYNSDFYNNNKYLDDLINMVYPDITKEDVEKLKKELFSPQSWIWYEEVR